jgi:hypothetical protein
MILGTASQTIGQTDPGTDNLTHQWTFDDGTADDQVGTVNGTLVDGASVADGVLNTSNGGHVELDGSALAINTYSELTVEAWFTSTPEANTGYHFLYYFGDTNADGLGELCTGYTPVRGADQAYSQALISTGDGEPGALSTEFDNGNLHHVVITIDASTLYYYVDGKIMSSTPINGNSLANVSTNFAYFAKGGWANDPTWYGEIDEINIYDQALSGDNVAYLFEQKSSLQSVDPGTSSLTHQWTFEDGTANDVIGNVDGTLVDGATIAEGALNTTSGGHVELDATELAINTYTQLTVETWFTSSAEANNGFHFLYYFGGSDGNGRNFTGFTPARGNDVSRVMLSTTADELGINSSEFDSGNLRHVVCAIDETDLYLYVDGNLIKTLPIGNNTLANIENQLAYFAKGGWENDPTWMGELHKISIYNEALTAENAKYLYDLGPDDYSTSIQPTNSINQNVYVNNNKIVAEFKASKGGDAVIEVYNMGGAAVVTEQFSANAGANIKEIDTNLPTGVYIVSITVDGETSYSKIVK